MNPKNFYLSILLDLDLGILTKIAKKIKSEQYVKNSS